MPSIVPRLSVCPRPPRSGPGCPLRIHRIRGARTGAVDARVDAGRMGAMAATVRSVRTGRNRPGSQARAALTGAAQAAFREPGGARATVADITGRAGISRAACDVYVAPKDAVLRVLTGQLASSRPAGVPAMTPDERGD